MTASDQYPDLEFHTVEAGKPGDPLDDRAVGWIQATARGFHQGRVDEEFVRGWREHVHADRVTVRGAWLAEPRVAPTTLPVATFASFDKTLHTGADLLPLRMITDVTVAPTQRRRGLLRRMITEDLQDAADRGVPLAALLVSEGTIYGRFGFGAATHVGVVEVDTTSRFALREPLGIDVDAGHVELAEPEDTWPVVSGIFDRFHAATRGSVERPHFYSKILTGRFSWTDKGPDKQLRAAVHVGPDGDPDGYVMYRVTGRDGDVGKAEVVDLVALTSTAYLRLWRFLADIDLVHRVRWNRAPAADPLEWALADPRVRKHTGVQDFLWVRVLDVPAALEGRLWSADGSVVLEVDDPLGHAAGRWQVRVDRGRAAVTPADASAPAVRLTAETLGSLYLGGVPVATLRDAGRLAGVDASLDTLAAMADGGPAPYCVTAF